MHSLRTRFIVVFGLFILLSSTIMGVFAAISIINTGVALCREQGVPIAQKADEVIDGDKFEELCKNPNVNNPPGNVGIVHVYILEIGKYFDIFLFITA